MSESPQRTTSASWLGNILNSIPRDWSLATLEQLTSEGAPICYGILKPGEYVDGGIPVVEVRSIKGGKINEDNILRTSPKISAEYQRSLLNEGDIVIAIRGSAGASALVSKNLHGANVSRDVARIRPRNGEGQFLNFSVKSDIVQHQIQANMIGQAVKGINIGTLKETKIPLPPERERNEICKILQRWDRAIDLTERLIAEKKKRRKWLMQQLLTGKRRLPGFGKPATKGDLPEGWKRPKTEKIFRNISRKNCPGEVVLSVTQNEGVVPRDSLDRKINMDHENTHTYKLVEPGDFIISLRSFQGGLEYSRHRGLVSPAYHVIRSIVEVSDDFYRHYFKSSEFIQRLAIATIGIRDGKQISYGDFSFMRLPVPPAEEQRAIAKVIDMADKEIDLLQSKADALREQKKGLMQQLLTGKKRVKV